jgi:hypothetical protein
MSHKRRLRSNITLGQNATPTLGLPLRLQTGDNKGSYGAGMEEKSYYFGVIMGHVRRVFFLGGSPGANISGTAKGKNRRLFSPEIFSAGFQAAHLHRPNPTQTFDHQQNFLFQDDVPY